MKHRMVMAAALLTVAAGCGSVGTSGDDGHVVTVVGWKGGGTEMASIPELNARFEREHPGVKVDFHYVASGDYDTYTNPRLAAGTAPDVLMVDKVHMTKWVSQGYLADLSDQPWVSTMDKSLRGFDSVDGKTYQFVQENIGVGLYANRELLAKAGVDQMPQDWPGLLAALRSVRARGGNGLMVADKAGWGGEQLALGLAANLVRPGWADDVNRGRASFSSDWVPVVDRLRELVGSGAVDGKLMLGLDPWSQALDEFKAGKWAFLVQGAWELGDFAKTVRFPFTLEPFPGGPAGSRPHSFTFVGTGLGVNSAAPHPDLAKEYVRFMARPDIEQRYLEAEAAFSPVPAIASTAPAPAKPLLDAFTEGRTVNSPAEVIDFTGTEPALSSALQKVFLDPTVSAADVLSELDRSIQANR